MHEIIIVVVAIVVLIVGVIVYGVISTTMGSEEDANKAIEALNGQNIEGRPLTVNIARPREERPGGGGGGGDRGRR